MPILLPLIKHEISLYHIVVLVIPFTHKFPNSIAHIVEIISFFLPRTLWGIAFKHHIFHFESSINVQFQLYACCPQIIVKHSEP